MVGHVFSACWEDGDVAFIYTFNTLIYKNNLFLSLALSRYFFHIVYLYSYLFILTMLFYLAISYKL